VIDVRGCYARYARDRRAAVYDRRENTVRLRATAHDRRTWLRMVVAHDRHVVAMHASRLQAAHRVPATPAWSIKKIISIFCVIYEA
jgi:hypothetical protein